MSKKGNEVVKNFRMDSELRKITREFLRLTGRSLRDLTTAARGRYYEICRTVYGTSPIPLYPFLRIVKGLEYLAKLEGKKA